jgi:hypothetical protein
MKIGKSTEEIGGNNACSLVNLGFIPQEYGFGNMKP